MVVDSKTGKRKENGVCQSEILESDSFISLYQNEFSLAFPTSKYASSPKPKKMFFSYTLCSKSEVYLRLMQSSVYVVFPVHLFFFLQLFVMYHGTSFLSGEKTNT